MCVKHSPAGDAQQIIALIIIISALVVNAYIVRVASFTSPGSAVSASEIGFLGAAL